MRAQDNLDIVCFIPCVFHIKLHSVLRVISVVIPYRIDRALDILDMFTLSPGYKTF